MAGTDNLRREYLNMIERVGERWLSMFADDPALYSAAYWDLLTGLWRVRGPVRKTEALGYMKGVKSPHTAGKYIETAIERGLVRQQDNPDDARSKLLTLSPDLREQLNGFFDEALKEIIATADRVRREGAPQA